MSNNEVFDTSVILKSTVAVGSSIGVTIGGVIGAIIFIIMFALFVVLAVVIAMKWRKDKWLGTRSQGTCTSHNMQLHNHSIAVLWICLNVTWET